MGAISEDDTGSKLAELEADDDDIQIGELTPEDSNDEQVNATQAVESEPQLDNPDLDLTALFDDPDDKQDDGSDFIDVDNLIQESESLTPASDDEVELNIDMSLDSFLSESNGIDVDIDADQTSNLDLARVYIDMEDTEAAIEALEQVIKKGNDSQQEEANALIQKLRE
jgi:pilus assembly protein FimV